MNKIFLSLVLLSVIFYACDDAEVICEDDSIIVTVEDWTGLDGCGLVFVHDSITYEPIMAWEGFCENITDGDQLCITFEEFPGASICMVGPIINVTSCHIVE